MGAADDAQPPAPVGPNTDGLDQLTQDDLNYLMSCAYQLCLGDSIEPEELLYETLGRLVVDQRTWRTDLPLRSQVYSAMRSVLFSWRKTRKAHPHIAWDEARDQLALDDGDGDMAVGDLDYEARVGQQLDQLEAEFADDPAARDLLQAALLGFEGADLETITGLSHAQVLAARKRLSRRLTKLAQTGVAP